ncbi:MAG: ABC transporter permease [Calditrichales bacterium]|nr:MAG: ABC transporter permease [Calditrichales bacterium]
MIALKLAYRNLVGAGLRTWLTVIVLSFSFVVIIWHRGMLEGWHQQARTDMIDWEIGGGQIWHKNYDPYDIFTLEESRGKVPAQWQGAIEANEMMPILIDRGTIYPQGRMQSVLLKGIPPGQKILKIPSGKLALEGEEIPAIIGTRMAVSTKLNRGDLVTMRWRDVNGTFDAAEIKIVDLFKTNVPNIDNGQIWLPLERFREMMQLPDAATLMVVSQQNNTEYSAADWVKKPTKELLYEIETMIRNKSIGGSILYIILMMLALLAIFDTQVLSIFRRQREIGTHIALGMTRGQVIRIFTIEGAMHGILAAIVAAMYGIPLLSMQAVNGFELPAGSDNYGFAVAEKIFPVYSFWLIIGTVIIVFVCTTIVSFIPTRRIAKLNPTDAIRGKVN